MFLSFMTACMTAFSIIVIPLVALTHTPVHIAMCERLPVYMITLHLGKTSQGHARSGLCEHNCHVLVMSDCLCIKSESNTCGIAGVCGIAE